MSLTLGQLFDTAGDDQPIDPIQLDRDQALLGVLAARLKWAMIDQQIGQSD